MGTDSFENITQSVKRFTDVWRRLHRSAVLTCGANNR